MTREEILQTAKPILFDGDIVKAILHRRKTEERRLVKPQPEKESDFIYRHGNGRWYIGSDDHDTLVKPPYISGDILYVKETWSVMSAEGRNGSFAWDCEYKADKSRRTIRTSDYEKYAAFAEKYFDRLGWFPSIHMPKEAARIFLRVTDVRAERLQLITEEGATNEGMGCWYLGMGESGYSVSFDSNAFYESAVGAFADFWNSSIKPEDRDRYGWKANPWVWVISFERIQEDEI